jgi:hypothetical protein
MVSHVRLLATASGLVGLDSASGLSGIAPGNYPFIGRRSTFIPLLGDSVIGLRHSRAGSKEN